MNIGILTVNDFKFHPNMRLNQAAQKRGHKVVLINPYDLIAGTDDKGFSLMHETLDKPMDLIMPRQGSPMGEYGLSLLRQFEYLNIPLINTRQGVTITRNQYITLQSLAAVNLPVPNTLFITKPETFDHAVQSLGGFPVIVKPVDGMGGAGILKADGETDISNELEELLTPKRGLLIQEFIPPEGRVDYRILVIGDQVAGAMKLSPKPGEFRSNINQNGSAYKTGLDPSLIKMAIDCTKACKLDIAGIDLVVDKNGRLRILEVNYSPGFKGLEAATGLDIADMMIQFVTSKF